MLQGKQFLHELSVNGEKGIMTHKILTQSLNPDIKRILFSKESTMTYDNTSPAEFSDQQAAFFINRSSMKERKERGQFFTPLSVARFMAGLSEYGKDVFRVLDPGGGTGILSCAACEAAAREKAVKRLEIDLYEIDPELVAFTNESLKFAKEWLKKQDIELSYRIIHEDFILSFQQGLWARKIARYDLAIANPPYFKIGKNDPRAVSAARFVYGQPNIYALFMGVAAELLEEQGIFVMITPRSFASGPYFRLFRQRFFDMVSPERVHLFESRKDAFQKDEVLQENIILKARRGGNNTLIDVSVSKGVADLHNPVSHRLSLSQVLDPADKGSILRLPVSNEDIEIIDTFEKWTGSLHRYGLEISTGPVVPFRAQNLIRDSEIRSNEFVPLIWMQNIQPMRVEWPCFHQKNGKSKPQFIKAGKEAFKRRLLTEDRNLVLLRRFSAKEQYRRLTAAPFLKGHVDSDVIGLENHVNYIYKPKGHMNKELTLGLAALLNSSLFDRYFRVSNGNTQVSATEIRAMPLPPLEVIHEIGNAAKGLKKNFTLQEMDQLVLDIIKGGSPLLNVAGGLAGG
ncbi:MAG: Eco57I restriction-modification methylase domain-containing protein [Pseudomonadota bacterium]